MDDNSSPQTNAGANEPNSAPNARQQPFQSSASRQDQPRSASNGTPKTSRTNSRSAPYVARSHAQAVAGQNGPVSLTPASETPVGLTPDSPNRQDVVMLDARGNQLQFPYYTQYPPIRIVENGAERVRGGSVRHRALAPRPALSEAGEGGSVDYEADTTHPLSLIASQAASTGSANGALLNVAQPRDSSPAKAPHTISPPALDPNKGQLLAEITFTGPYYLPSLINPAAAAENSYISPYPPLQQTLEPCATASAVNGLQLSAAPPHLPNGSQPVSNIESPYISPYPPPEQFLNPQENHASAATSLTEPITHDALHNAIAGAQSQASSVSTLQGEATNMEDSQGTLQGQPENTEDSQTLHMSQSEQSNVPALDSLDTLIEFRADFDPLGTGTANDDAHEGLEIPSAGNGNDTDWLTSLSWDDFPVVDSDFDFDFASAGGL